MRKCGNWLYAAMSFLAGMALGRLLVQQRQEKTQRPGQTTVPALRQQRALTRQDMLRRIEENGGPQGLDLAYTNWRRADLSGMILNGISFRGADLRQADLTGSWLAKCDFREARMWRATLPGACLWLARLDGADLKECDFRRALLVDASFRDALLTGSQLQGALLQRAIFANTPVTQRDIGNHILIEQAEPLIHFADEFDAHFEELRAEDPGVAGWVTENLPRRYELAAETYLMLKNNFDQIGRYNDASWAYIKERQMERMSKAPWRARQYQGQAQPLSMERRGSYQSLPPWHPLTWWFWLKHAFLWLLDWVTELTCGYGERPGRTLTLAGLILVAFPFIYWAVQGLGWVDPATGRDVISTRFLDYVIYSAGAFVTIGYEGLRPINTAAQIWTAVEALLGISILALLMFALGNRIGRS